jgi:hypothetical protein
MADKRPQRTRSHEIEDLARGSFFEKKPAQWASNESRADYGWDILVTIPSAPQRVGDDFFVQLKGSDTVNYLSQTKELSHPLEVTTVNWLLAKPIPTMLAVCDVVASGKPIYWVWLRDAVERLQIINPAWKEQDTVTIRIPLVNTFNAESFASIEDEVKAQHELTRFGRELFRAVGNQSVGSVIEIERSDRTFQEQRHVLTRLHKVGLIGITETDQYLEAEVLTEPDLKLKEKVREVSILVSAYQEAAAARILDDVKDDIPTAPVAVKAAYTNCRAVLALHSGRDDEALGLFLAASALRPDDSKYAANVLATEYKIALISKNSVPADWDDRLSKLLDKTPDNETAIRLRAARLATAENLETAEQYLKQSVLWGEKKREALTTLAELYREQGKLDGALEVIEEAEKESTPGRDDALLFSLKGGLLLDKAVGLRTEDREEVLRGFGPANLDIGKLRASADAYLEACRLFTAQGYPQISETTFINAATVLQLLGEHDTVKRLSRSFLELHPDSGLVHESLAISLWQSGDPVTAVAHSRTAFKARPDTSQYYINYLVVLLATEDYEQLLQEASERQKSGFRSNREEHFTRAVSAIAYAEKGTFNLAEEQVKLLFESEESYADAVGAEIAVSRRRGIGDTELASLLRNHLKKSPDDPYILTILAHHLLPPSEATADELIRCLNVIREHRQLSPDEIFVLGRAYLVKDALDDAERVFRSGRVRFANDHRFVLELAHVAVSKGDEESAYNIMADCIKGVGTDPVHYWNLGLLARITGRLGESISILQKALSKERDPVVIRKIHFLLFDSKRRQGASAKELLRHVISFGELTKGDPDEEARFLMMAFLIPSDAQEFEDPEVREWAQKIRARLESFVTAHPKSRALRRLTLPQGTSDENQGLYFLAEVIALQLPQILASVQIELSARGRPFPLVFRKKFLGHGQSIFDYWELCTRSTEFSHAIHIWYEASDFAAELDAVTLTEPVCVDISALLTLQALGLLDDLQGIFPEIVLSRGTVRAIRGELTGLGNPHRMAIQLDAWLKANRTKLRIRPAYGVQDFESQPEGSYVWNGTIWTPVQKSFAQLLGDGVGESVIVAQNTGTALYCDDVAVRITATNEYHIPSFSTLALMNLLQSKKRISVANEAECLAKLITLNFRHVRFSANHLNDRLLKLLVSQERPIKVASLNADAILGVFLRQFGDREITDLSLIQVASDWWATLIGDNRIPDDIAAGLIASLTYKLSQRTLDNVLEGVAKNRPTYRIAIIWAFFMIRLYSSRKEDALPRVWSTLKTAATELASNEKELNHLLYEVIPIALYQMITKATYLDDNQKTIALVSIPQKFDPADRERFEAKISKLLF